MRKSGAYTIYLTGFWLFIALFTLSQDLAGQLMRKGTVSIGKWTVVGGLHWALWAILTPFVVHYFNTHSVIRPTLRVTVLRGLALVGSLSLLHVGLLAFLVNGYLYVLRGTEFSSMTTTLLLCPYTLSFNLLVLNIILGITIVVDQYKQAYELKSELAQAQLCALKSQLQPHFLFNTHNAINTLILQKKNEQASMMLGKLSELLRATLDSRNLMFVPFKEELKVLKLYLDIHQVRFGGCLQFVYDIDPDVLDCEIPSFLLQPLVENSIRHGISQSSTSGLIKILACRDEGMVSIKVEDDGPGEPNSIVEGVGLSSTRSRLLQSYGVDAYVLEYGNAKGGGFYVTLKLPRERK